MVKSDLVQIILQPVALECAFVLLTVIILHLVRNAFCRSKSLIAALEMASSFPHTSRGWKVLRDKQVNQIKLNNEETGRGIIFPLALQKISKRDFTKHLYSEISHSRTGHKFSFRQLKSLCKTWRQSLYGVL